MDKSVDVQHNLNHVKVNSYESSRIQSNKPEIRYRALSPISKIASATARFIDFG
jgi:hypothetical protein